MKSLKLTSGLRAGILAIGVAALVTPALAQGNGSGAKGTTENPTTHPSPTQRQSDVVRPNPMGGNTGTMQRATPRPGTSSGSEAGSGGGQAAGSGGAPQQPTSDPRANPDTPVSPVR